MTQKSDDITLSQKHMACLSDVLRINLITMKSNYIIPCFLFLLFFSSCTKEEPPENHDDDPIEFISLTAGRDTIFIEDTTQITATASGYELTYIWSVEKGDILGSGNSVTYVATPCTVGDNPIICTVKSSNGKEETKNVIVTVL